MSQPLMPWATAVWLVENTSLSFAQIADFCGIHVLEVQGIADETVATRIVGLDPVRNGQLTQEEIDRCQADPATRLKMLAGPEQVKRTKGPRYTPVSKRQDKPDGIAWLLRNHPELTDGQIGRLIGSTKQTIAAIRDKSHWNIANIRPQDPVALGLCRQRDLDAQVLKIAKKMGETPVDTRMADETALLEAELRQKRIDDQAALALEGEHGIE
jgi:uncharacterized protein